MVILSLKTVIILSWLDFFNVCLFTFIVLGDATYCYSNRLGFDFQLKLKCLKLHYVKLLNYILYSKQKRLF